ncbi:MAG: glycosyltransferase family 2 protein [Ignavibacteria bacterium]|jgi:glycosyltransferase involved in cell wall biosynthesis
MTEKNQPLLTIAIPTYNRASILSIALDKLLPQVTEFSDEIEVIISDNGSTDNTQEIIKNHTAQYSKLNFKVYSQTFNTGYFGNFKKCRELSDGKYLWLLSDNEHLKGDAIKILLNIIKKNREAGVYYLTNKNSSFANLIEERDSVTFFAQEKAYLITLISSSIFLNEKKNDNFLFEQYKENSFLGFLFLANALMVNRTIYLVNGNLYKSYPCNVYFDIFKSWTKDISKCLIYLVDNNVINLEVKKVFINGYLKHVIYFHVWQCLMRGGIYGRHYGSSYELKSKLDKYYSEYFHYQNYVVSLFSTPRVILKTRFLLRRVKNKLKRTFGIV